MKENETVVFMTPADFGKLIKLELGKLARIICAIIDIIWSIGLSMYCINNDKPGMVPLFGVIAIGMVIWLFDYTKSKKNLSFDWTLIEDQGRLKIYRKLLKSGEFVYTQAYTAKTEEDYMNAVKQANDFAALYNKRPDKVLVGFQK